MRVIILSLMLCIASIGTAKADADSFPSEVALKNYWFSQPWVVRTVIFLDGRKVVTTPGFGPSYFQQYFRCSTTNDVRKVCGSRDDGSATLDHLVNLMPGVWISYNDQRIQQGDGLSFASIITCRGDSDPGLRGPITFEWVEFYTDGFGPFPPTRPCP